MRAAFRIPFRFKILATVLVLVTTAVGIITFTMARMFHTDKSAYVSDLAAVMAVHAAEEADLVLESHRDRLLEMARVIDDPDISSDRKRDLLTQVFAGMHGCVAVRIFEGVNEIGALADTASAETAPLAHASLVFPLAPHMSGLEPGRIAVINATPPGAREQVLGLLVAHPRATEGPPLILAAMLATDHTFSLGRNSAAFDLFLADSTGHVLWHTDAEKSSSTLPVVSRIPAGSRAVVRQYVLGGVDMIGGFAGVRTAGLQAGSQIPRSAALFASRQLLRELIFVALLLLFCAALTSLVWSTRLTASLAQLAKAAQRIGHGDFDVQVKVSARDEMGDLAGSFNQMATELHVRDRALREAQAQLIQSEKMAAFGQLGAGIAHEVKNPLAGIQGLVQLVATLVPTDAPMAPHLAMIEREAKRCRTIIDNLLKFARQEKMELEPIMLATVVNDTAGIMRHQMKMHKVELRVEVDPALPLIRASANQIEQVLMNLMLNAAQAMQERGRGTVTLSAKSTADGFVELRVADDGPGIPKAIRSRIFEPFFTTKPAGKGTGLGLSVTFGIVRDHGGQIALESEEGKGATFILRFPALAIAKNAPVATREERAGGDAEPKAA